MARDFCPTIRVKCSRKYSQGSDSLNSAKGKRGWKARSFKAAKKRLRAAYGLGNVHPGAEMTSLPAATVAKVAHAASNPAQRCTVSMGGKTWKLKGQAVGQKVATLIRTQRAGGCCSPKVTRG